MNLYSLRPLLSEVCISFSLTSCEMSFKDKTFISKDADTSLQLTTPL